MIQTSTRNSRIPVSALGLLLLLLAGGRSGFAQEAASGMLKIGDQQYELKYVTAVRIPDTFDENRQATRLSLSDLPVSEADLRDRSGISTLKSKGGFHGVTFDIGDERSYVSMNLWSSDHSLIVSMSGTMGEVSLSGQTATGIAGEVKDLANTVSGVLFSVSARFSASVKPQPEAPKADVKKGAATAELESVKTYLTMRKAVRAADMETIRKLARYPQDFEGAAGEQFVKLMQSEEPMDIQVLEAWEAGDTATLTVSGVLEGKPISRKFEMQKVKGKWSTKNDNWQSN